MAAEREERSKLRRYDGLSITPFVLENGGRAGESAQGLVRALADMAGGQDYCSQFASRLWQEISIALQGGVAWQLASAYVAPSSLSCAGGA